MPYIGNTVQNQGFTPAIDYFSGNGVTVTFTLTRPVASVAQMIVAVDNVIQNPSTAFTVSGSSITFTSAPLSGTNNIWVEYTSLITTYAAISQDPSVIGDITASGGYLSTGDFGNSYIDGTIVDYVTGNARITTGPADGLTIYNGGTSARTALAAWDQSGNLTNTGNGSFNGVYIGRGAGSISTNTGVGSGSLNANTSGATNTAVGYQSAYTNTTGSYISALGYQAAYTSNNGGTICAVGYQAAYSNTTGEDNTAVGSYRPLYTNSTGSANTAIGRQALYSNTASNNTAVGYQAGYSTTTGANNTYIGRVAGYTATTASDNTFVGLQAGYLTTGYGNTYVGTSAGYSTSSGIQNTFIGQGAGELVTTGTKNTILGKYNGNQGALDIRTQSNYIVISDGDGNPRFSIDGSGIPAFTGLYAHTTSAGANVYVDGNTTLYRSTSSLKYKTNVQDATHGLAEVMTLRPVTYSGIGDIDSDKTFGGLIAEEVHEAGLTEFVQYAEDGSPDALAYGHMVSLCVKAIQELKAEVDSLKAQLEAK